MAANPSALCRTLQLTISLVVFLVSHAHERQSQATAASNSRSRRNWQQYARKVGGPLEELTSFLLVANPSNLHGMPMVPNSQLSRLHRNSAIRIAAHIETPRLGYPGRAKSAAMMSVVTRESVSAAFDHFLDAWSKKDAKSIDDLVTENASIHWKNVIPEGWPPKRTWTTWSRGWHEFRQYCTDEECKIVADFQELPQEVKDMNSFCQDMKQDIDEIKDHRNVSITGEGDHSTATILTKAQMQMGLFRKNGNAKIVLTLIKDKIDDIAIEVQC